jgi:hypothetical protein
MKPEPPQDHELYQEPDTFPAWKVLLGMFVVVAVSALMIIWAWAETRAGTRARRPDMHFPERYLGPRRRINEVEQSLFDTETDALFLIEMQRRDLERYEWLDPSQGTVRIPIDQAIDHLDGDTR